LPPLVAAITDALLPYIDQPFALFGHSMGALVSFEVARQLRRTQGVLPVHLFVSAHSAPQLARHHFIHTLPDRQFLEEVRQLNGTPDEVLAHSELRELFLPILRADFAVCETYAYTDDQPLSCPISAFGGLRDEHVKLDNLKAWREQTSASFSLRMFPGDHFFMNTDRLFLIQALVHDLSHFVR
jgi:medium-chain acyl-[acyl-carrier-protein] hydrolase